METSMKPGKQCTKAAKVANFTLGQIQRAFHFRTKKTLVPLYKLFVDPNSNLRYKPGAHGKKEIRRYWKKFRSK